MLDADFNQYIGQRIREKRKAINMPVSTLADLIKISPQQIQKYESGASQISANRLVLIAHILHEPVDYFYQDINWDSITIGNEQTPTVIAADRTRKLNILLLENNPEEVFLFQTICDASDHVGEVFVKDTVRDTVDFLRTRNANLGQKLPDLILLDLNLPTESGFDALKKIKEDRTLQHLVVLMLTGSVNWNDMIKSYQLGAASYICKTDADSDYVGHITDVINYWAKRAILPIH